MKSPWAEMDDDLRLYFQALAEEPVPEEGVERGRVAYRGLVHALRPASAPAQSRGWVWRWALAAAFSLLLLWASGTVVARAASQALPGSPLYPLKRWHETWQLLRARSPQARIALHQEFARRRVHEMRDLLTRGRAQDLTPLLDDLLTHVDALATLAQAQPAAGPPGSDLTAEIQALLPATDPAYRTALLRALNALSQGQRFTGVLQQRQGTTWQVDGVEVLVAPDTLIQGLPQPGDVVEVVGDPLGPDRWQARWVRVAARAAADSVGDITVVGEIEPDDAGWRIGGHVFTVTDPDLARRIVPDTLVEVHLRWDPQREMWVAEAIQPKVTYTGRTQEFQGRVEAVEPGRVRIAGQWWDVSSEAKVEGALQVGVWAKVEAWQDAQGNWHVVEVETTHGGHETPDAGGEHDEHDEKREEHDEHDEHDEREEEGHTPAAPARGPRAHVPQEHAA